MSDPFELTFSARVRVKTDVLVQNLDGEAVLLDVSSGTYFGLNEVGARVWDLLREDRTLTEICLALVEEFDVAPEQLRDDMIRHVRELHAKGLVVY